MSRSKKYQSNQAKIKQALNNQEFLPLEQALEVLYSLEQPKFANGTSVEVHFKLNINPTKSDQLVRSSVVLPNGTGKQVKVVAFVTPENVEIAKKAGAYLAGGEELIEEIKKSGNVDFDKTIAQPEMMKKLPVIARLLGTAGVMPNPKTGTVGDNVEEMIKTILAGKVDFKNDKTGNVHIMCGRINNSFTQAQMLENLQAVVDAVEKSKPEGVKKKFIVAGYLASSMSPSIRFM